MTIDEVRKLREEVERWRSESWRLEEVIAARLAGEKEYAPVLKAIHESRARAALAAAPTLTTKDSDR